MNLDISGRGDISLDEYDQDHHSPLSFYLHPLNFERSPLSVCEINIDSGSDMDGSSRRMWENMDQDCLVNIFSRVLTLDLLMSVSFVCKTWHEASFNPQCWTLLDFRKFGYDIDDDYLIPTPSFSQLLHLAASRSQGHTTILLMPAGRLSWYNLIEPEDLDFMADAFKGLRILICGWVTEEDTALRLAQVIGKWSDLEGLSIGEDQPQFAQTLAAVAGGCPRFHQLHLFAMDLSHQDAAAIADGFGPRFTYLRLVNVSIQKNDLLSILRACKGLRTLHIQNCRGFENDDQELLECGNGVQNFFYRPLEYSSNEEDYQYGLSIKDVYDGNSDEGYYL